MADIKNMAGVLSKAVKLICESPGINPDRMQSLFNRGLFTDLLLCPKPHKVNREEFCRTLGIPDFTSIRRLGEFPDQILKEASNSREAPISWENAMRQAERKIWSIIMTSPDSGWTYLSERYHAEACAFLLYWAYGRQMTELVLKWAADVLQKEMSTMIPCYICNWSGSFYGLRCEACKGTKLLPVHAVPCPECGGIHGLDKTSVCSVCGYIKGLGILPVDCFNRPIPDHTMVEDMLGIPRIIPPA